MGIDIGEKEGASSRSYSSLAELLPKQDVTGSNPVTRSNVVAPGGCLPCRPRFSHCGLRPVLGYISPRSGLERRRTRARTMATTTNMAAQPVISP
jgi:hypothetical protein